MAATILSGDVEMGITSMSTLSCGPRSVYDFGNS